MSRLHYDYGNPAPVIQTTSGAVQGRWQTASSAAYLGIPFAKDPVGELRFLAPEPYPAWKGVRSACEYGPTPQRRPFGPVTTIPEPSIPGDCTLNVNVFTPAPRNRSAHLPVFVWIHGGGYFAGSPSSPWYNGRSFNRDGVVTVSVSYRLGFQGFGWVKGAPLNRGMLDQIAALKWVRDNIEEFGGDPDRVTIGGQSAGGGSVLALLGSPMAQGLFRGAISESGPLNNVTVKQAEKLGREMAEAVGIEPTLEAWSKVDENTILDHERDHNEVEDIPSAVFDAKSLISYATSGLAGESNLGFAPAVDGAFLTEPLALSYAHGTGSDVSLLMGSVRNEFSYPVPSPETAENAAKALSKAGISDAAIAHYTDEVHRIGEDRAVGQLMTVGMFQLPIARTVASRSAAGAARNTWLYDFGQTSSVTNATMHCDEIPYAFDVLDDPHVRNVLGDQPSQTLADAVHGRWVEFISTGKLDAPSTAEHACGALRFIGAESYDEKAYLLPHELLALK